MVARGRGAVLAKFDVLGAFRTVPVHPDDRGLLGMRWRDKVYVDNRPVVSSKGVQCSGRRPALDPDKA